MRGRFTLLAGFAAALVAALGLLALLVRAPAAGGDAAESAFSARAPAGDPPGAPPAPTRSADPAGGRPTDAAAQPELPQLAWREPPARGGSRAAEPGEAEGAPPIPRPRAYEPASARDARRYEIHRIYNRREYDAAATAARAWLEERPGDRQMLRIAASAACILGKREEAAELLARMVHRDRTVIRDRCARHGVVFDP